MGRHPSATAILIDPSPASRGMLPSLTLASGPIGWVATMGFVEKSEVERTGWEARRYGQKPLFCGLYGLLFHGRVATFYSAELLYNGC
jgi:hypothetical protein